MKTSSLVFRSLIPASAADVFAWHARPGAFARYNPPWDPVTVVEESGTIEPGARKVIRLRLGPLWRTWVAEHRDFEPGRMFRDVQTRGPFARWEHTHTVVPSGDDACLLEDSIDFVLPLGALGRFLGLRMTRDMLQRVFAYRHRTLQLDMAALQPYRERRSMKILISGAGGLIGSDLSAFLNTAGHEVVALTRQQGKPNSIYWDPLKGDIEADKLMGFDAVIHLAGESIVGRWNAEKKQRIRDSRVKGTQLLCETLARLDQPPRTLLCASAIGYYGNRGDEELTESSRPGDTFLSQVCAEWEEATAPARNKGMRVCNLRIGVVLSPRGGALAKMLTPFRMGTGGKIGSGRQWMSWIALDDVVGAFHHALQTETLVGPVNVVSPHPATNLEFTKTLGRVLCRPTVFPLPGFMARLMFGEMADELLLGSARILPTRLQESGYQFRHPNLEEALRYLLGKQKAEQAA